ncbi:MAG: hypothetical protein DCC55_25680 [Chloroflexi bacterium]|nr:MAG: hypothetical protein DCC55_25680 [Chloroflexota bacterium]
MGVPMKLTDQINDATLEEIRAVLRRANADYLAQQVQADAALERLAQQTRQAVKEAQLGSDTQHQRQKPERVIPCRAQN